MNPSLPQRPGRPLPPRPQRPVFDVMRPGRAPASSTSKPIIGHKPIVRDTSITGTNPAPMRRPLMSSGQKIHIQPASTPAAPPVHPMRPAPAVTPVAADIPAPTALPPAQQPVMRSTVPVSPTQLAAVPQLANTGPLTVPTPAPTAHNPNLNGDASDDALFNNLTSPAANPETYSNTAVSRRVGHGEFPLKNTILSVVVALLIIMLIDILIDADFITSGLPHTHLF